MGTNFPDKNATFFSENRVGGSEAVWKFSENSLNLVQIVIPNRNLSIIHMTIVVFRPIDM